jgi:predicted membrane protein
MFKNGDFYSIDYQYVFIAKYMTALEEKNGYEELILLPPPLNFLLIPLIIASFSRESMSKVTYYYKQLMFWIENVFLTLCFLFYFIMLSPYIYIKKCF